MMSWIIFLGLIFFILNKVPQGLRKMIKENEERAIQEFEEAAKRNEERDAQLAAWREEAHLTENSSTYSTAPLDTLKGYQMIDVPVEHEGGRLLVEVLDKEDHSSTNVFAEEILNLENDPEGIQHKLRTAIVMKEILERKYE